MMNHLQEILLLAFVVLGVLVLFRRGRLTNYPWQAAAVALILAGSGFGVWSGKLSAKVEQQTRLKEELPGKTEGRGLVTSDTCRSCHPQPYQSWHDSYHRRMTQVAKPDSVIGSFDNVELHTWGHDYRLFRKGDEFWVATDDPYWEPSRKPVATGMMERQIVMTTGSHHYQVYWVDSPSEGTYINLPFVYMAQEKRWVPREFVFINPVPPGRQRGFWNVNCIRCHTTANVPGYAPWDSKAPVLEHDTRIGEMGIACEACHGPGEKHVEHQRNLVSRYAQHFAGTPDPTIVNPARLTPERSAQVCGQCHSIHVDKDFEAWRKNGTAYKAGDDLDDYRSVAVPKLRPNDYYYQTFINPQGRATETHFWKDGMVRVAGREYSAMRSSKCNINEGLACIDCHSMHKSGNPDDQLITGRETDEHCFKCHPTFRDKIAEHTHHAPGGPGASCYNCHMPHTTYGLLSAIRSHLIDSPNVDATTATDRPNACNLCHLDKTIQWTADRLKDWYGQEPKLPIPQQLRDTASGPYYALKGDANQRALIAWHMGWKPSLETSSDEWIAPYLIQMLDDPYRAIRFIAGKSLTRLKGFEAFVFDFAGDDGPIPAQKAQAMNIWENHNHDALPKPEVLLQAGPRINKPAYENLLAGRDNRQIELDE